MLKYLISILTILLFGTVFFTFQDIPSGTIESKNYGFFLIGIISILVLLGVLLLSKSIKFEIHRYDILIFLFGGWVLINTLILKQLPSSITLSAFVCSIAVSLVFKQVISNMPNILNTLVMIIILIGIGQVLLGLLQLYGFTNSFHSGFKMTGSFHNPGPFGIYVGILFVFSLGYYLFSTSETIKNIAASFCLLSMLVLPVTQSRTAWIGIVVGTCYLAVMKYELEYFKKYYTNKLIVAASLVLTVALGVGLWALKANSALGRILIWRVSASMVKTQPLTGIGFGEYGFKYGFYQADYFKNNPESSKPFTQLADISGYAFNDFLQILIENGLIGFCLFVAALIYVLFSKTATISEHLHPSKAGIIAILLAATCSYPFENIAIWWLLLFLIGVMAVHLKSQFSFVISKMVSFPVLISMVIIAIVLIKNLTVEYPIMQQWKQAQDAFNRGKSKQSESLLSKISPQFKNDKLFLMQYGRVFLQNKKPDKSLEVLLKIAPNVADNKLYANIGTCYTAQKKYELAEKYYWQSINMIPSKMLPRFFLVKMYLQKGDTTQAKNMAQYLVRMPVKVSTDVNKQIITEMTKLLKSQTTPKTI
jgi:O-antigen polymerase